MELFFELIEWSEIDKLLKSYNISHNEIHSCLTLCLKKILAKEKLLPQILEEISLHTKTKYHQENWITHAYCVGYITSHFASNFNIGSEYAFELGFFHDIGKPWAKQFINIKNKSFINYKGHAQIGQHIANYLNLPSSSLWAIGNHMCSCAHHGNLDNNFALCSSYQQISWNDQTDYMLYINSLACLMLGDQLGRIIVNDIAMNPEILLSHSYKWRNMFIKKINNDTNLGSTTRILKSLYSSPIIIIHMLGHSGFGKSTTANILINKFKSTNNISYIERDECYYNVYAANNNISKSEAKEIPYNKIHTSVINSLYKSQVQENWTQNLNLGLESGAQIIIIDSVQIIYPYSWNQTINSLSSIAKEIYQSSFKLAYYGFPLHLLDINYEPKTLTYQNIPRSITDNLQWPILNSELINDTNKISSTNIDVGYGIIEPIINIITNYLSSNNNSNLVSKLYESFTYNNQQHLIILINKLLLLNSSPDSNYLLNSICELFSPGIIIAGIEYSFTNCDILRYCYKDGIQIFCGPTRDYRGETIIFDKNTNTAHVLRVSLPVLVDYSVIKKDIFAMDEIKINEPGKFNVLPKYDGSLFVMALVKKNTPGYILLFQHIQSVHNNETKIPYIITDDGIWCLGSKNCIFAKNQMFEDNGVLNRIYTSIEASYKNINKFIDALTLTINQDVFAKNNWENISIIFEAIDSNTTNELTVIYDKSACPLLCFIVFDGINKKIILPDPVISQYLNPVAKIYSFDTWGQVLNFQSLAHTELLNGSFDYEPEGHIVWIANTNVGIKLKHQEYYVAHKPLSIKNISKSREIEFNSKYAKLKNRFSKFTLKPLIRSLFESDLIILFKLLSFKRQYLDTKKAWALYWKNNTQIYGITESMENNICIYYPQYKNHLKMKHLAIALAFFDLDNIYEINFNKFFDLFIK